MSSIIRVEFPDAPVRAAFPIGEAVRLSDLGGRLVTAMVSVQGRPDVIGQRVYAHAGDVPCLDLGTLRHRGRLVTVSEWTDHVRGQPVIGATLKPVFVGGPETVEVTDYLAVITTKETAQESAAAGRS